MGRYRVFAMLVLSLCAVISFATDYRLVVASDDAGIRKSPSIVIFEGTGKLNKEDRITSITFSAAADVKPNCLISLDAASGKSAIALSPDVQVYQGKVMIAGVKPTRKVIPAHLEVDVPVPSGAKDGKLGSVMQPIIQQVNNLPWAYIVMGVGLFMGVMFFMNRRSQQYTTSMSKEAKNLYLETVGRITERLERIESNQDRLVKNPPVVRTFKAQIEDFEGRLTRIERLAKEGKDEMGRAAAELSQSDKRHDDLVGRLESAKREASATQTSLKQEADALRAELKLLLKGQDEAKVQLQTMEELKAFSLQISEQNRQLEAQLAAQQELLMQAQGDHQKQLQQLQGEIATLRANQESLLSMPRELELVSASMAKLPAEFESVRSSMPRLEGVEGRLDGFSSRFDSVDSLSSRFDSVDAKLDSIEGLGSRLDSVDNKLEALPEIRNSLESLPSQFPHVDDALANVHDSILRQIESLSGKISESGASLSELLSAHSFSAPESAGEEPEAKTETKKSKKGKAAKVEEPVCEEEVEPEAVLEAALEVEAIEEVVEPEAEVVEELPSEEAVVPEVEAIEEATQPEAEVLVEEAVAPEVEAVEEVIEPEAEVVEEFPAEEAVAPEVEAVEEAPEPEAEVETLVEEPEAIEEVVAVEPDPEPVAEVEEPVAEAPVQHHVTELQYRYKDETPAVPEFHFNNAIKKMTQEEPVVQLKEETTKVGKEAPLTFHLEELPDHLATFEDDEPDAVLSTFHVENGGLDRDPVGETEAVEQVLRQLDAPKSVSQDVEAFDADQEEHADAHAGHWYGFGGSSARTWSSESSRALELRNFTGELKPLTPIETAPIGDNIGALVYGFGRVVYACGSNVRGFWPGKDERHTSVDQNVPLDEWRLAVKGQNLFVVGEKKVKIVSIQSWFVLEQFTGQYVDQLITNTRWAGLKHDNGPVIDFRDFRGQMANEVRLDMDAEGLRLCASEARVFAASRDGRVVEVSQFGTEALGNGPDGGELLHLAAYGDVPLALYRVNGNLECWLFGEEVKSVSLDMSNYGGVPVLLGGKLYLADLDRSELVSLNLKKMQRSSVRALEGVESIRRMIGVQHKSQHELFIITTDSGKKGGRLIMVDAKTGHESCFGSVGQANVNLICADHHVVLSTSSEYQNVIRVLEPFAERIAA